MVETTLKSILPDAEITLLSENKDFNFKIKMLKSKALKNVVIFTEGLSSRIQDVKEGFEPFKKIELYFLLPDYWDLEKIIWPAKWINIVATLPQKNDTWFGPGDTIPIGNPPEMVMVPFEANHFLLAEPILLKELFEHEEWLKTEIKPLAIIPISQAEVDYKLRNSAMVLLRKILKAGYTERGDNYRKSVCRKRILGMF